MKKLKKLFMSILCKRVKDSRLRSSIAIVLTLSFLLFFVIPILNADATQQQKTLNTIGLLFYQEADVASLTPYKKRCFQLTLKGIKSTILYISNQPQKLAGLLPLNQFLHPWGQFNKTKTLAREAILHGRMLENNISVSFSAALLLMDPIYDEKNQTLRYTVCSIHDSEQPKKWIKKIFDTDLFQNKGVVKLTEVHIFIDTFHPWPP